MHPLYVSAAARLGRLVARVREFARRLAFWKNRKVVAVNRQLERVVPHTGAPVMKLGQFVVRIPSVPTGFREVHRSSSGAAARDEWRKRLVAGRAPEFWDAPDGTPRRRA